MKNPFKRTKKTHDRKGEIRLEMARVVLDLPVAALKEGIDIHFDERGARPIEKETPPDLSALGVRFEVGYDPNFRGSFDWRVAFMPSYTFRGQCFGVDGAALVNEVGLEIPHGAEVKVADDGLITWFTQGRPTDDQVETFVRGTQKQIENIMREYGRTRAFLNVGMAKKKA